MIRAPTRTGPTNREIQIFWSNKISNKQPEGCLEPSWERKIKQEENEECYPMNSKLEAQWEQTQSFKRMLESSFCLVSSSHQIKLNY